jgi:hypothetical protein
MLVATNVANISGLASFEFEELGWICQQLDESDTMTALFQIEFAALWDIGCGVLVIILSAIHG